MTTVDQHASSLLAIELWRVVSLSQDGCWNFQDIASVIDQARQRRYKSTMAAKRKTNKGGHYLRYEPSDMNLLNEDSTTLEVFRRTGCLQFFQRLKGCYVKVSKDFAINFNGTTSKVGMLNLTITPETIAETTGIPRGEEKWFKGFKFTMQECKEFIKLEHSEIDLKNAILRSYMKEKIGRASCRERVSSPV